MHELFDVWRIIAAGLGEDGHAYVLDDVSGVMSGATKRFRYIALAALTR
jgi:hypothetical protein